MNTEKLLAKIDSLINQAKAVLATRIRKPNTLTYVDSGKMSGLRAASLAFLGSVFGNDHTYSKEFDSASDDSYDHNAEKSLAILLSARTDISEGWLSSIGDLVSATIFADMLEMADHLCEQQYKSAAAVSAGCVLETHLRRLCEKNNVEIAFVRDGKSLPKKADAMNSDLVKASAYNKLDQKNVTSWLGLRNEAAHGHESTFELSQVRLMIDGVSNFIARTA